MIARNILFVVLMFWGLFLPKHAFTQLSPGDLAQPHEHLEGLINCTLCHELGKKVSDKLCLDCHKLLNNRIVENKEYHVSSEVRGKTCIACHSDHHGRNFRIINWDTAAFNHNLTGYILKGKHAETNCKSCHKQSNIIDLKIKDKKFTYLGLTTKCLSCHDDYHQKSLENDCLKCHDFKIFKPAPGFDHQLSAYPLVGKHLDVKCIECHPMQKINDKESQLFKPLEYKSCVACHEDIHKGKFGKDCKKCHSEMSFRQIKGLNSFDHSLTKYSLTGQHQFVMCKECHKSNYTDPLKYGRCMDCHEDYHKADFTLTNKQSDCDDCHTTNGFKSSSFSIEQHQQGNFVLRDAHLATPCFACHFKDNLWVFRNIGQVCVDCHTDPHEAVVSQKYYPESDCRSCHNEQSWRQIQFDHSKTGYELMGQHQATDCRDCHFKTDKETSTTQQVFSKLPNACINCHTDKHAGQFVENDQNNCNRCHNADNWQPALFNHELTRFALEGAHSKLTCKQCHKPASINNQFVINYKIDYRCEACH